MAYMVRMLPVGFVNTYDMIKTLQTAGLGSLELFCMGLKAMGSYLARTLSYHGANFVMDDVQLSPQFRCEMERCVCCAACFAACAEVCCDCSYLPAAGRTHMSAAQLCFRACAVACSGSSMTVRQSTGSCCGR
jgi:hypothetical protein